MGIKAPELLTDEHVLDVFSCGKPELDDWLIKKALKNLKRNNTRVYVVCDDNNKVIGYYAIAMGSVQRESALSSLKRNSPNPIPMVVLARLAVDEGYKGRGIGVGLLKDCVLRSVHAMNVVGGAGILVHAIDDEAKAFYKRFGFNESPIDAMTLMARVIDIEASQT
ncbi:GNAT family N-acetyltransferase [Pseudoalteromonas shioyasakiensis]|uniref:GNAT family N-acetyltransferase n=2 Tax=Pseudoalteromonas TaxID=53246 RepID=UPI0007B91E8E|nr:GNAT family N-acetyltransferase [Pseudoalteromonas shioyasakiensis]KZY45715.1 GCN5 family acetyltransferase [Pseudoalteromonas shioyasakiensis]MCZ4249866.1 GNAT family N-acetyltransferase [Pseudoalteromonas shioyasakiensis]